MKIVVINGQNHKGSTYHIGKLLTERIAGAKSIQEFFLPRDLNHFCGGCYTCVEDETRCPYYAEKHVIMQAVEEADVLILTTPNYCMAPSAPMNCSVCSTPAASRAGISSMSRNRRMPMALMRLRSR